MKTITIKLTRSSIDRAIKDIRRYQKDIENRADRLCKKLANVGADVVKVEYGTLEPYVTDQPKDFNITVAGSDGKYVIRANGWDVLFLEFGSGKAYGNQHPEIKSYGAGTFPIPPGKGHWDDPKGWHTPIYGQPTTGNPASAGMYWAKVDMCVELRDLVREVFNG